MALVARLTKVCRLASTVRFASSSSSSISPAFSTASKRSERKLIDIWEPEYLKDAMCDVPEYDLINVQMKGYDFLILEDFQRKVSWLAKEMGLETSDAWAQEHKKIKVVRLKAKSATPDAEFHLKVYERNVQVANVSTVQASIFAELIATTCPPGVNVSIHPHTEEIEESRYVPDYKVEELRDQLSQLSSGKK